MKTRIATALASLLIVSMGTAAYAQGMQQQPPHQTTPEQQPPQQTTPPQQMPQQPMPPQQSASSSQSMSQNSMGNSMSSDKIEQKIKKELTAHGVTATNVTVSFQDGTATLTGTVNSKRDIRKAKSAAMRVRGVKHVDTSGLQVQSQGAGSSGEQ